MPEVWDEKPKAGMTRALLFEDDGLSALKEEASEQTKLERLHSELTELQARIAEVEAATERDLAAQPEAAMRRHNMRQAERVRIQREIEELQARKASASQALQVLLADQAAEGERSRQVYEALEGEAASLRAALEEERSDMRRLVGLRQAQEAQAAAEEAEVARLQAYADNLRKEIVAADFRRDRAEAEAASKRKVHRWGTLCTLFLVHEQDRVWQLEVEAFEAEVSSSELAAGTEAPVSPRPDGFYARACA